MDSHIDGLICSYFFFQDSIIHCLASSALALLRYATDVSYYITGSQQWQILLLVSLETGHQWSQKRKQAGMCGAQTQKSPVVSRRKQTYIIIYDFCHDLYEELAATHHYIIQRRWLRGWGAEYKFKNKQFCIKIWFVCSHFVPRVHFVWSPFTHLLVFLNTEPWCTEKMGLFNWTNESVLTLNT